MEDYKKQLVEVETKNEKVKHKITGKPYKLITDNFMFKQNGKWIKNLVLYQTLFDNPDGKFFARTKEDFEENFVLLEKEDKSQTLKEKAYDEALERARKIHSETEFDYEKGMMEEVFPELKESKDEKIKKDLTTFLDDVWHLGKNANFDKWGKADCSDWIAWIEKQGEQKPPIIDFKAENWYVSKVDGKTHEMTYNPADKNKPKFKVRDWVVNRYFTREVSQITKILDNGYEVTDKDGHVTIWTQFDEHNSRLWTIEDAKIGDILTDYDKSIFIYAGIAGLFAQSFVAVARTGKLNTEKGGWGVKTAVAPATKEQRDLLFRKMKEAGYEWDAEHKRLKKIRWKAAEWSEYDESGLDGALWAIERAKTIVRDESDKWTLGYTERWLKSLRP